MNEEKCYHILRERTIKQDKSYQRHAGFDWFCLICGAKIEKNNL